MSDRVRYTPDPARGAELRKDGEQWTLILVKELRHSPERRSKRPKAQNS